MAALVSIIIPCFNAERWVGEAIQSCLDQTWPNKEIIVIDDGSTDKSLEVIQSFGDKIRWETGPNRGGCAARNRGSRLARGEWLQFLDADDVLNSQKIHLQMVGISSGNFTASTCRLIVCPSPKDETYVLPRMSDFRMSGKDFLVSWQSEQLDRLINPEKTNKITFGNSSSWIISKSVYLKTGGWNECLCMCQDSEFFAKVAVNSSFIEVNSKAYGFYRVGSQNSVSSGVTRQKAESFLQYCKTSEILLRQAEVQNCSLAIATNYFWFISRFSSHYPDLVNEAFALLRKNNLSVELGIHSRKLRFISKLLGLRMALRIHRRFSN